MANTLFDDWSDDAIKHQGYSWEAESWPATGPASARPSSAACTDCHATCRASLSSVCPRLCGSLGVGHAPAQTPAEAMQQMQSSSVLVALALRNNHPQHRGAGGQVLAVGSAPFAESLGDWLPVVPHALWRGRWTLEPTAHQGLQPSNLQLAEPSSKSLSQASC